jgi:hypothetical protein
MRISGRSFGNPNTIKSVSLVFFAFVCPAYLANHIVPIENIKEIRSGEDARYYRQQFQLSQDYQDRWLTIIYLLDGNYKTLHLISATKDVFRIWDKTLRELHAIRQELMRGLGNGEMRQALWEKYHWTGADEGRLTFDEVEKLCRRLNINSNHEDLFRLFKVVFVPFFYLNVWFHFLFLFSSKLIHRDVIFLISMISATLSSC